MEADIEYRKRRSSGFLWTLRFKLPRSEGAMESGETLQAFLGSLCAAAQKGRVDTVRRYAALVKPCVRHTDAEAFLDVVLHCVTPKADSEGFSDRLLLECSESPECARIYAKVVPHVITDAMLPAWCERVIENFRAEEHRRIENDVRDRLAAGAPVDFQAVARQLAELDSLGIEAESSRGKPLSEILNACYNTNHDAVSGLLPAGGVLLLAGEPKSGKSWLAYRLALDYGAPEPQPWFGHFATHGGRVCILTDISECVESQFQTRMRLLRATGHERVFLLMPYMLGLPRLSLSSPSDFAALRDALAALGLGEGDLLIVDSMTRFMGGDENSSAVVDEFFRTLRALTPAAKVLIHHLRKAGQFDDAANAFARLRGSSDIHAAVDAVLLVKRDGNDHELRLSSRYHPDVEPFRILREVDGEGCLKFSYSEAPAVLTAETVFDILTDAGEPMPRQVLLEKTGDRGIGRAACDEAVGHLLRAKRIAKDRRGREVTYYVL